MAVMLDWPLSILSPRNVAVYPEYMTRPDMEATNGMRRSAGMSGLVFRLKLIDIPVHDEATYRTMMAMLGQMEGNSQLVRIKVPDLYGIDGPYSLATAASRAAYPLGIPFATDVMFATGVGHAVPTLETSLSSAAALNDREVYFEDEVPGGCIISIDEFCYITSGAWSEDGANRVRLSPVLRKAADEGAVVSLAPVFVGICVTSSPGSEDRQYGRYGFYSFEFVEDLTRLVEGVG